MNKKTEQQFATICEQLTTSVKRQKTRIAIDIFNEFDPQRAANIFYDTLEKGDVDTLQDSVISKIESCLNREGIVKVHVKCSGMNGQVFCDGEIDAKEVQYVNEFGMQNAKANGTDAQQNILSGFLGALLGVPMQGLGATEVVQTIATAGIGMQQQRFDMEKDKIRMEHKFELQDVQRTLKEKEAENAKLNAQVVQLTEQNKKHEKEITRLNKELDEYDEELQKRKNLDPRNSVAGISLAGALSLAGEMLIKKHAAGLGGLMGIDGEAIKRAMEVSEDADAAEVTPTSNSAVDIEPQDERTEVINAAKNMLRQLSTDEFNRVIQILTAFESDKSKIDTVFDLVTNG